MAELDHLLTLDEVCQHIGVSRSTVYNYMAECKFPLPLKFGTQRGSKIRFKSSEIAAWIDALPRAAIQR